MADNTLDTIKLARAQEALRQEREAFDQLKKHADKRFALQGAIGWVAVVMIPVIAAICAYIIFNSQNFTSGTITAATAALFVDVLGLLISVWKVFLNPASIPKLEPVTRDVDLPPQEHGVARPIPQIEHRVQAMQSANVSANGAE